MNNGKRYTGKADRTLVLFFVLGIVLLLSGVFLHSKERSAVLPQIFIDLGAGLIISSLVAHLVS